MKPVNDGIFNLREQPRQPWKQYELKWHGNSENKERVGTEHGSVNKSSSNMNLMARQQW